jgi:hypothetical protein
MRWLLKTDGTANRGNIWYGSQIYRPTSDTDVYTRPDVTWRVRCWYMRPWGATPCAVVEGAERNQKPEVNERLVYHLRKKKRKSQGRPAFAYESSHSVLIIKKNNKWQAPKIARKGRSLRRNPAVLTVLSLQRNNVNASEQPWIKSLIITTGKNSRVKIELTSGS